VEKKRKAPIPTQKVLANKKKSKKNSKKRRNQLLRKKENTSIAQTKQLK